MLPCSRASMRRRGVGASVLSPKSSAMTSLSNSPRGYCAAGVVHPWTI
jgi:hypothetical protein